MGYRGETYFIQCNNGGLNHNANIDAIPTTDIVHPSRNISLHENGYRKRPGTAHQYGAAMSDTPRGMGVYDFMLENQNQHIVTAWKDGKVYRDDTNTIKTGMSTTNHFCFTRFENELYIVDGETTMQTWNGVAASTSNVTTPAADWTGSNHPSQIIKHGRGATERLWALGCQDDPRRIYGSAEKDGQTWTTGVFTMQIDTNDGFGIVGGIEFGDRLVLFGKEQAFLLDDEDASQANWGYEGAQWYGGVAHWRLLTRTPNDIVAMMEDGNIYSASAAQEYGDYKLASLTKPANIDRWIADYIDLAYINDFYSIYDPVMRTVLFFVVRKGQTTIDTAMAYYIDRPPEIAWTIFSNQTSDSGYSASAGGLVRVGAGNYKIYTQDYSGWLWRLGEVTRSDNALGYYGGAKFPNMTLEEPRKTKDFKRGIVGTEAKGAYDLQCVSIVDGRIKTTQTVSLAGTNDTFGAGTVFGTAKWGGTVIINSMFEIRDKGLRTQTELYNSNAGEDFFISSLSYDYKKLGRRPS